MNVSVLINTTLSVKEHPTARVAGKCGFHGNKFAYTPTVNRPHKNYNIQEDPEETRLSSVVCSYGPIRGHEYY